MRVASKMFPGSDIDQKVFIEESLANLKTFIEPREAVSEADLIVEAIVVNIQAPAIQKARRTGVRRDDLCLQY